MKTLALIIVSITFITAKAQNLFPIKLNNCPTTRFCLDCGDQKASVDSMMFRNLINDLNTSSSFKNLSGKIQMQVLVSDNGKGCVLSHTDINKNKGTLLIIKQLNRFEGWIPAVTENKPEEKTSINMEFEIKNGILSGKVNRVDIKAFEASFDKPESPEIYNKKYVYTNQHLQDYTITTWNSKNSNLENNQNDVIALDTAGIPWVTANEGLLYLMESDGEFINSAPEIQKKNNYIALEIDNQNTLWVFAYQTLYSYSKNQWKKYAIEEIGISRGYDIINNPLTNEVYFCSDEGLTIYKEGAWSNLNQTKIPQLPSNRVYFAKKDTKNRIWIGTFSGSIMIDEKGIVTSFNTSDTPLKNKCITSMAEDENGNLYFGLFEFNPEKPGTINNKNEGIAVCYANGDWKQFTTSNSGMPFNHTSSLIYDPFEKVIWIATSRAGLVRYDLKDSWENYHNENSAIPTSYISDITQDQNGTLFIATRQGVVKMSKKQQ